jgi:hypothetical protein
VPCANAVLENMTAMAPSAPNTSLCNMDFLPVRACNEGSTWKNADDIYGKLRLYPCEI